MPMETTEEVGMREEVSLMLPAPTEVTALRAVNLPVDREVAYTIKEGRMPRFKVYKSANAWWMDDRKVKDLIDAFKGGHTVKDSCIYADITRGEWEYFNEVHPEFSGVREACEAYQTFGFMDTVNTNKDDPTMARWFMEKTHPKFNPKKVGEGAPLQPTVNVAIGANVDAGVIAATIREIAREVFASAGGGGAADTGGADSALAGAQ